MIKQICEYEQSQNKVLAKAKLSQERLSIPRKGYFFIYIVVYVFLRFIQTMYTALTSYGKDLRQFNFRLTTV